MAEIKHYPLLQSFRFAFRGITEAIKSERNLKIHLVMALLAILLGLIVGLTRIEWAIIVLVIFVILAAELFNSAIEGICNLLKEENNLDYEKTRLVRDISAGTTLLLAIASVIIAIFVYLPYFL